MNKLLLLVGTSLMASFSSAISVEVQVFRHSYCGRESGYAVAMVSGGVPPYTYEWSNGSTDMQASGLFPGNYSLTVTDALLDQAMDNFTIDLLPGYGFFGQFSALARCSGDAAIVQAFPVLSDYDPTISFGPPPYTYSSSENAQWFTSMECQDQMSQWTDLLVFSGVDPGMYTVDFTDGNGCPGNIEVYISPELTDLPQVQALSVQPSCASTATGAITFSHEGPMTHEYLVLLRPDAVSGECAPQVRTEFIGANAPGGTRVFGNLLPGDYWLITSTDAYRWLAGTPYSSEACKDSTLVTVPSLGVDCGVLSGRVYIDDDADCTLDGLENRVPGTIVEITPGPLYVTTSSTGLYSIGLNFGDYTVNEQNANYDQSCPGAVTLASGNQTLNIGCAGGAPLDVQLAMANGPARPGFQVEYGIDIDNLTASATGAVTLTVTLDPNLGFISAIPAPITVAGSVITWNLIMDQVFQHVDVSVRTQVPPDVGLIGSTLTTTAQITTANSDGDLTNNSATSAQLVTGSYDPNDKLAITSTGGTSVWSIAEDEWIDYTIRFQNTGTDTAFNVVITDTLPPTLDPASIAWGAGSHPHSRQVFGPGVLKFIFPNILLPDSNVNEPLSHGFVSFRIRPRQPIAPGTVIENIANIYFDFNPPVITEPSVLVAEFSTGIQVQGQEAMLLQPNPVGQVLSISATSTLSSLRIISADGRAVHAQRVHATTAVVDVAALKAGAYLLIAELNDGTTARERFIKQ
ncbi:MAG: T9SS type A sorting domain-containing protein [Flavobacteriales bacterium]